MAFIGMIDDYEKKLENEGYSKMGAHKDENIKMLSFDDIEPLSDDDLLILKQTRVREDPYTVFMQPLLDFYDEFYNVEEGDIEANELYREARQIKRVHKSYSKYLYSMYIRDKYMDLLIDKYADGDPDEFFSKYRAGLIDEWLPPMLVFSKSSPEYDLYKRGSLDVHTDGIELDDIINSIEEITEQKKNEMGMTDDDIVDIDHVVVPLTDIRIIKNLNQYTSQIPTNRLTSDNSHTIGGVSIKDLDGIQKMFDSWYREDKEKSKKNTNTSDDLFSLTPEKIIEDFYDSKIPRSRDYVLGKMDEYQEPEPDPNEMVMDKNNRPISRREYWRREYIEMMEERGFSGTKLMERLNIGTEKERKLKAIKERRRKQGEKIGKEIMSSITGDNPSDTVSVSSLDELRSLIGYGED